VNGSTLERPDQVDPALPLPVRAPLFARASASVRYAIPALLAYIGVRAFGLAILAVWAWSRDDGLVRRLYSWDSLWYGKIALYGYDHGLRSTGALPHGYSDLAFFPAYPILIRVAHVLTGLPVRPVAIGIAWVASLAAAWGIFKVADHLYGRRVGVFAALLWGVLPNSVIQQMAYSESLFTAFAAWSLYSAVRKRWITAALLAVLAGLTRPTGVAVAAAISLAALVEIVRRLRRRFADSDSLAGLWHAALAMVLAPLGWFGYVAWVSYRLQRTNGYLLVQHSWKSDYDWHMPVFTWMAHLVLRARPVPLAFVSVSLMVGLGLVLLAITIVQRQPIALITFSVVLLLIALGDHRYIWCEARFLLPAFPLLLPIARGLADAKHRATPYPIVAAAAVASAVLSANFLLLDVVNGQNYFP
jgi:hypothetical protein